MAIYDKKRIYDRFTTLHGRVDAGRRNNVIGCNEAVSAESAIFRSGTPGIRPRIPKLSQSITNPNRSYWLNGHVALFNIVHGLPSALVAEWSPAGRELSRAIRQLTSAQSGGLEDTQCPGAAPSAEDNHYPVPGTVRRPSVDAKQ